MTRAEASSASSGYEELLRSLAADEHVAGKRYLALRSKLVLYFEGRRLSPADDLADEVLHRTAQKLADGEKIDDLNRYVYGIARFVRLETYRKRESESLDEAVADGTHKVSDKLKVDPIDSGDDDSPLTERCLSECLSKLANESKDLLLSYYAADERSGMHIEQRRTLAEKLGKSAGALQKQICLLRQKVSRCTHECVNQ